MSHHYSGPDWGFPRGDARLDLTDLYVFPKPGDPGRSILITNMHPSIGENPLGPTMTEPFATQALHEIRIDTDGDAVADITFRIRFAATAGGPQTATLRRIDGTQPAVSGDEGELLIADAPVSMAQHALITEGGGVRMFAGWRSDPFFFDRRGALNNLQFTGADFFIDKNVCSIVLDVPNAMLGQGRLGLWHRILVPGDGIAGGWVQAERGARPLQLFLVLGLSAPEQFAYLTGEPAADGQFVAAFAHALEHTGGYPAEEAKGIAESMLPEMMRYDPARPASYPDNGRTLTDDAVDAFLPILTNGKLTGDEVGPHSDLLGDFPYLGPPHAG